MNEYELMMVPHGALASLKLWVEERCEPGDFLSAVLKNDLKEAVGRADPYNMAGLKYIVMFLYNHCPGRCWGSAANFENWTGNANWDWEGLEWNGRFPSPKKQGI